MRDYLTLHDAVRGDLQQRLTEITTIGHALILTLTTRVK